MSRARSPVRFGLQQFQELYGLSQRSFAADPCSVNAEATDLRPRPDSLAVGTGVFLTRAIGSGSGRVIVVDDARYFSDGFGLLEGDLIQIGRAVAQVLQIDYGTGCMDLDRKLAWIAGDDAALPFSGAAADLGAREALSSRR